jgi:hypothetical protein
MNKEQRCNFTAEFYQKADLYSTTRGCSIILKCYFNVSVL